MSLEALTWAFKSEPYSPTGKPLPTAKMVLLVLADHAGQNGECFPGLKLLAKKALQSENTVRARLDDLVNCGLIFRTSRTRDNGSHASNEYVLLIDDRARAYAASCGWIPIAPLTIAPPADDAQLPLDLDPDSESIEGRGSNCSEGGGATGCGGVVQLLGPLEPSLKPSNEPSPPNPLRGNLVGVDPPDEKNDLWFEFEPKYPWAENEPKHAARRTFDRLKPDEQLLAIAHAKRYGDDCLGRGRKICFAKTWLRDKGWEPYVELVAKAAAEGRVIDQVWVEKGTEAWEAWDIVFRATENSRGMPAIKVPSQKRPGIYRSALFPPKDGRPAPLSLSAQPRTMH